LLNSTPLGEVINERQLHRHRTRAGLQIGDARHVDLLRYAAWLAGVRRTPKPTTGGDPYETVKDRARARNIALSLAGRGIGGLPLPAETASDDELTADQIAGKFNRMERGEVPGRVQPHHRVHRPAGQLALLARGRMGGRLHRVRPRLRHVHRSEAGVLHAPRRPPHTRGRDRDGRIGGGHLRRPRTVDRRVARQSLAAGRRRGPSGRTLPDRRRLGTSTDVVYQFCRQSAHAGIVLPSHGRFVGASSQPFNDYKKRPGDRVGFNWRMPNVRGKRAVRHALFDTNFWKSFVPARLAVAMGEKGCLSLFGDKAEAHRLLAEHLTAENRIKTEGRGRTVDEWEMRAERSDNHWLDCLVGAAVAASIQGVVLFGTDGRAPGERERVSFAELQRRNRR